MKKFAFAALLAAASSFAHAAGEAITVYKDPNCGCCTAWIEHLREAGVAELAGDRGLCPGGDGAVGAHHEQQGALGAGLGRAGHRRERGLRAVRTDDDGPVPHRAHLVSTCDDDLDRVIQVMAGWFQQVKGPRPGLSRASAGVVRRPRRPCQTPGVGHRATLVDVAARAGTSRTTAHYVLTGQDREMRIAEDTRRRVLRAAHELQYRPDLMARGLRTRVTRTLALVTDSVASEAYAGELVNGALAAAAEHGHLLFVCETGEDAELEEQLVQELLARHVDAYLYAAYFTREVRVPSALRDQRVVLLNCCTADDALPLVAPDGVVVHWLAREGAEHGTHLVPAVQEAADRLLAGSAGRTCSGLCTTLRPLRNLK